MARILITQRLVEGALTPLEGADHEVTYRDQPTPMPREELLEAGRTIDALVCTLADRIDVELLTAAARHGVAVCNTPGVLDAATADVAMLLMLAARRRSSDREAELREGRWQGWGIADNLALDLSGATLGLVGYGRIGRAVARRAAAFDMEVLHHTRTPTGEQGWIRSLLELASRSDILSIHVGLTESTVGLIGAEVLGALRPTSVVINTARGPVLDEGALAEALEQGRLWGAGLDVYVEEPSVDPRLLAAPHTVLLPHIGSATQGTRLAMCRLALTGALGVLSGTSPTNLVRSQH